jgi:hypothetical protein
MNSRPGLVFGIIVVMASAASLIPIHQVKAQVVPTGTIATPQNQSSEFGYFQNRATAAPPPSYLTNTHTQKPILTCDQPGHASCYDLGYSKGLLNSRLSCSAATLNSFVIDNPSQVNDFCSGYRIAAQQALQQQR